jgi:hypothetical protein
LNLIPLIIVGSFLSLNKGSFYAVFIAGECLLDNLDCWIIHTYITKGMFI